MEFVKNSMDDGSCDDADVGNEHHAAEKSIKGRKYFTALCLYFYHWTHAAENHGCVVRRIHPPRSGGVVITGYANQKTAK